MGEMRKKYESQGTAQAVLTFKKISKWIFDAPICRHFQNRPSIGLPNDRPIRRLNCLPKAWRTVCRTIRQTAAPERKTLGRPQNLLFTVFGFRIVLVVRRRFMVLDVRIVAFKIEIRTVVQVMALDADRF